MGRKKSYDRDELVGKAMELFRDHGFAGTSAEMLVESLGVNRFSLYAEFGSKQGLFDAALERYDDQVLGQSFGRLETPGAGVDEIRALLEFFGTAGHGRGYGRGCLLCNTAVEFGPDDPSGAGFVQRYFKRLSRAFLAALSHAREQGDLPDSVDPKEESAFFTATVLGLFVMARAKAPRALMKSSARVAIEHLDALCADTEP